MGFIDYHGTKENRYGDLVSWNGAAPKYDLRDWAPEYEKMGRGVTLAKEEAMTLKELLSKELQDVEDR